MKLTGVFKWIFYLVLGAMALAGLVMLIAQPEPEGPPPGAPTQAELTVQAEVNLRLTQTAAAVATPAPADVQATVAARLTITPPPSPTPEPPSTAETLQNALGPVWTIISAVWNLFAFGGVWLQVCCCILIPLGLLLVLARDLRPRR
jgi:hypothetical protein